MRPKSIESPSRPRAPNTEVENPPPDLSLLLDPDDRRRATFDGFATYPSPVVNSEKRYWPSKKIGVEKSRDPMKFDKAPYPSQELSSSLVEPWKARVDGSKKSPMTAPALVDPLFSPSSFRSPSRFVPPSRNPQD